MNLTELKAARIAAKAAGVANADKLQADDLQEYYVQTELSPLDAVVASATQTQAKSNQASNPPKKSKFIGTVSDFSDVISKNNRSFRILYLTDAEGDTQTFVVSCDAGQAKPGQSAPKSFWERNKERFVYDRVLAIEVEETIEGVTTWNGVDKNGMEGNHLHTSSGKNIVNAIAATGVQVNETLTKRIDERNESMADKIAAKLAGIGGDANTLTLAMANIYGKMIVDVNK